MSSEDEEETGSIWDGNETVWHAWVPECDACGRAEASLTGKGVFFNVRGKECQKQDWSNGHKNQCHLYEANRKLSRAFAKSLGPGTVNDPKLSQQEKLAQWSFLNVANRLVIASAALKNDPKFAATKNVALLLSCANGRAGSKYEHRSFFVDRDEPPTSPGADDDDVMRLESVSDPEEEDLVDDGDISSASYAPSSSVSHDISRASHAAAPTFSHTQAGRAGVIDLELLNV